MGIVKETKLWLKDARCYLFKAPRSKYQFLDKVIVIGLIVFPLILVFMFLVLD